MTCTHIIDYYSILVNIYIYYTHIFVTICPNEPRTSLVSFEFGHVNLRLGPLMTKRKTAMHHLSLQANALTSTLLEETVLPVMIEMPIEITWKEMKTTC